MDITNRKQMPENIVDIISCDISKEYPHLGINNVFYFCPTA